MYLAWILYFGSGFSCPFLLSPWQWTMFSIPLIRISHFSLDRCPMQSTRLPLNLSPWQWFKGSGWVLSYPISWEVHMGSESASESILNTEELNTLSWIHSPKSYFLEKEEDKELKVEQNCSIVQLSSSLPFSHCSVSKSWDLQTIKVWGYTVTSGQYTDYKFSSTENKQKVSLT